MTAPKRLPLDEEAIQLRQATRGFTAPFILYIGALVLEHGAHLSPAIVHPVRLGLVVAAILVFSRPYLTKRPACAFSSVLVGLAVFAIWVAPDLLFHYRHFWLFENPFTGSATSSLPPTLRRNWAFLLLRVVSSSAAVPILEELFWRGWLMRWVIDKNFLKVPLGTYTPFSFWTVAILFASEHGPYWDVGLVAGVLYNWWMIRTKNLADCMVAHGVTNACLAAYVLATGLWSYWL